MSEFYIATARDRMKQVAESLADPAADLAGRSFLARPWWVDELLTALARARTGRAGLAFLGSDGGIAPLDEDPPNLPPVAQDDGYEITHDTDLVVAAPGLVYNDYDNDGDEFTAVLASSPQHAAFFDFQGDGSFQYTPAYHYVGTDSFTYYVTDGIAVSSVANVVIGVLNQPPSANPIGDQYHWVQDPSTVGISLWDHFQDPDDSDSQLTYTVQGNTNPSVVSPSIDPGTGILTLTFGAATGFADLTIRATDRPGEYAESTFRVWVVEVTGYTVAANSWEEGWRDATGQLLWVSDEHRWSARYEPAEASAIIGGVTWGYKPWEFWDDPSYPYSEFAASPGDAPVITPEGVPGPGDWAISPGVQFGSLFVQMTTPERQPMIAITSVEWQGVDPGDGHTNLSQPGGATMSIYPERNHPIGATNALGGPIDQIHDRVDLRVTISPAPQPEWGATIYLKIYDPDNTQTGEADPNDSPDQPRLPDDNQAAVREADKRSRRWAPSLSIDPSSVFSLDFGEGTTTRWRQMRITNPQPGNNFVAVASPRPQVVGALRFREDGSSLFYRSPSTGREYDVPGSSRSPILEVWRTLWVESDHMGDPGPNDGPFDGEPGADDDPRFTPQNPTMETLTRLLEPAYVRVRALPAQYDQEDTTEFLHYRNAYPPQGLAVRDVDTTDYYWTVHLLGAYEWSSEADNDPNNEPWLLGWSAKQGGTSFVLEEAARDVWAEPEMPNMVPYALGLDRISAHEALHHFFGWHDLQAPYANEGIMDPPTLMTAAAVQLTQRQLWVIQASREPKAFL